MKLRAVPQLQFKHDESVERGMRISQLIDAAVAEDAGRGKRRKKR
jgi:ribosome-binding factor A